MVETPEPSLNTKQKHDLSSFPQNIRETLLEIRKLFALDRYYAFVNFLIKQHNLGIEGERKIKLADTIRGQLQQAEQQVRNLDRELTAARNKIASLESRGPAR